MFRMESVVAGFLVFKNLKGVIEKIGMKCEMTFIVLNSGSRLGCVTVGNHSRGV